MVEFKTIEQLMRFVEFIKSNGMNHPKDTNELVYFLNIYDLMEESDTDKARFLTQ